MEQLSKYVSAETNSRNNKRAVFCAVRAEGLLKGQRRSFKAGEFRDATCQVMSLGAEELN
jgi:hypothetical protein